MSEASPVDFNPSKLGTREHWDDVYAREIEAFDEIADEGEVWFGEDVLEKMVDWVLENLPPGSPGPRIIDIGTGNGVTLLDLAEAGYSPLSLCGIDYSSTSVTFARSVAESRDFPEITFRQCDILFDMPAQIEGMEGVSDWDLVLDKGTFDAVSLGSYPQLPAPASRLYPVRVSSLLHPGGFLLITSCNFTEQEIRTLFETSETHLRFHSRVNHRSFSFGGKSGSVVCTVAFVKEETA